MNDWTNGYVSDIEYLPGFYVEQTPAHMDVACLLRGVEPPVEEGRALRLLRVGLWCRRDGADDRRGQSAKQRLGF
jgi:hypothetical protein